jgi:hypothetical protein
MAWKNKGARSHRVLVSGGRIKTDDTRKYEAAFTAHLSAFDVQIKSFLESITEPLGKVCLKAEYDFYFPAHRYYTKKGLLNLKTGDTDNFVKIAQDLIFKKLQTNDGYVIEYTTRRLPCHGETGYIWARVEVCPLPKI